MWLGKSELTDEHLVRTDGGVVYARSVRRLAEHSWSEVNLRAVVETPQKPKSTTVDIPPAADPLAPLLLKHQKCLKMRRRNPQMKKCRRGAVGTQNMTPRASSSSRGEKRTETQEGTFVKKRLTTEEPSTEKRTATFADEPVKRRPIGHRWWCKCRVRWASVHISGKGTKVAANLGHHLRLRGRQIRTLDRASRRVPTMPPQDPLFGHSPFPQRHSSVLGKHWNHNVHCVASFGSTLHVFNDMFMMFGWDKNMFRH